MQSTLPTIIPGTHTGTDLANWMNAWRDTLHSMHSGSSRPSYAVPGMLWLDTSAGASDWVVKFFDGTRDLSLWSINTVTGVLSAAVTGGGSGGGGVSGDTAIRVIQADSTITASDWGNLLIVDSTAPITLTISSDFTQSDPGISQSCLVLRRGTGTVSFSGGSTIETPVLPEQIGVWPFKGSIKTSGNATFSAVSRANLVPNQVAQATPCWALLCAFQFAAANLSRSIPAPRLNGTAMLPAVQQSSTDGSTRTVLSFWYLTGLQGTSGVSLDWVFGEAVNSFTGYLVLINGVSQSMPLDGADTLALIQDSAAKSISVTSDGPQRRLFGVSAGVGVNLGLAPTLIDVSQQGIQQSAIGSEGATAATDHTSNLFRATFATTNLQRNLGVTWAAASNGAHGVMMFRPVQETGVTILGPSSGHNIAAQFQTVGVMSLGTGQVALSGAF